MDADRAVADELISSALRERVEAFAAGERRAARDVLREAIEGYLDHHGGMTPRGETDVSAGPRKLTPQEAGARMRERRRFRPMPEGVTIREMIDAGRA